MHWTFLLADGNNLPQPVHLMIVFTKLLLGKNKLFNDWIMQKMAPHSLGSTTLLYKSVLPITMIFSMISFFGEKLLIKPVLH